MTLITMEFEALKSRLVKASKAMEKTELVELHNLRMRDYDETGNDWQLTSEEKDEMLGRMSTEAKLSKQQFLPLEELTKISLLELTLETRHEGRVLYGTLCVEAFFLNFVQTLVEDDDGKVMTVIIDDPELDCLSSWGKVKIRYCEGAKIAIKEPYLSSLPDTSLALYVNMEDDIEILSETQSVPVSPWSKLDAADLRTEGNRFFAKEDWVGAIDLYSKCIMKSMETLRSKPPPKPRRKKGSVAVNGGGSPFLGTNRLGFSDPETVMLAYSNRAAAWMKLRHFEKALIDSGEALKLDPTHLKSIYRKGRALHGLQQYEQACETFQSALLLSAHDKDIKVALQRSRTCDLQSRLGVYEISKYILGTCEGGTTECSDYVGPVEIKWCEKLSRRGLFVTTDVDVGQLLLVSNALSVVRVDGTNPKKVEGPSGRSNMLLRDELLFKLYNLALKSPKWLHQMSFLTDSENQEKCPPMDLFKPNRTWDSFSLLDMPLARIKSIILQNAFDESGSCARGLHNNRLPGENNRQFLGLWALPSFINHSCCPNSIRLHLGDTLFLHASRQLESGEEVTISYVNSLLPLPMRRELLIQDRWEFQCRCVRCEIELRLRDPLKHICKRVYDLWGTKESAVAGHPQSLIMAKNALNVEHQLNLHTLYLQERQLIRGSYFNAYWSAYLNLDQLGNHALNIPPPETMVDALNISSPGDPMTLYFAAYWLKRFEEQGASKAVIKDAQRRAMHICKCMYGKQKSEVLKRLIKAHAAG